jgi:hypothetical protein
MHGQTVFLHGQLVSTYQEYHIPQNSTAPEAITRMFPCRSAILPAAKQTSTKMVSKIPEGYFFSPHLRLPLFELILVELAMNSQANLDQQLEVIIAWRDTGSFELQDIPGQQISSQTPKWKPPGPSSPQQNNVRLPRSVSHRDIGLQFKVAFHNGPQQLNENGMPLLLLGHEHTLI